MKNIINSLILSSVLMVVSFANQLSFNTGIIVLLIIAAWVYLAIIQIEYTVIFCIMGYLNVFRINFSIQVSQNAFSPLPIFLVLLLLSYVIVNEHNKEDKNVRSIKKLVLLFFLYQTTISIIPHLVLGNLSWEMFLLNKDRYYGLLFFFPSFYLGKYHTRSVYVFFIIYLMWFYIVYFLSVLNIFPLIEMVQQNVMEGHEFTRLRFELKQVLKIFVYFVPIILLLQIKYRSIISLLALAGLFGLILNVFRTELLYISIGIIFNTYLIIKLKVIKLNYVLSSVILFSLSILILINLLSTDVITNAFMAIRATSSSATDLYSFYHRFYEILPNHLSVWSSNIWYFLFGYGFQDALNENILTPREIAIWDVSISGVLMSYGLIGTGIYLLIYKDIIKRFKLLYMRIKLKPELLKDKNDYLFPWALGLGFYFITTIFFRTYYTFWELSFSSLLVEFGFFMGLFYGVNSLLVEHYK